MSEKSNEFIDGYCTSLNAIRPLLTYCRNGIVRKSLGYGRIATRILVAGGAGFKRGEDRPGRKDVNISKIT